MAFSAKMFRSPDDSNSFLFEITNNSRDDALPFSAFTASLYRGQEEEWIDRQLFNGSGTGSAIPPGQTVAIWCNSADPDDPSNTYMDCRIIDVIYQVFGQDENSLGCTIDITDGEDTVTISAADIITQDLDPQTGDFTLSAAVYIEDGTNSFILTIQNNSDSPAVIGIADWNSESPDTSTAAGIGYVPAHGSTTFSTSDESLDRFNLKDAVCAIVEQCYDNYRTGNTFKVAIVITPVGGLDYDPDFTRNAVWKTGTFNMIEVTTPVVSNSRRTSQQGYTYTFDVARPAYTNAVLHMYTEDYVEDDVSLGTIPAGGKTFNYDVITALTDDSVADWIADMIDYDSYAHIKLYFDCAGYKSDPFILTKQDFPVAAASYPVTVSATYCKAVYLSTNSSAASGSPSGTSFDAGTTVYGFATLNDNTSQYTYTAPSGWTLISGRTYRIGSCVVSSSGNTISGTATRTLNSYTITFTNPSYGSWGSTSKTAYYGDKITTSGTTVTCYQGQSSTSRWTNTVTKTADTVQYTYTTPTVSGGNINSVTGAATISASNTRSLQLYTVTFSSTNGSWSNTSIANVPYGTTWSTSGTTVTLSGSKGSSTYTKRATTVDYNVGDATISATSGTVTGNTTITGVTATSARTYTVKWIGADGSTVLETDSNVAYNATLTYNSSTPTKASTDQYSYVFSAWKLGSTSGSTVTSGTTKNPGSTSSTTINIYSTFTSSERNYTVTFTGTDGSWNNSASISAKYSAAITVSGTSVTVTGNTARTWSATSKTGYRATAKIAPATSTTVGTGKTFDGFVVYTAKNTNITLTKNSNVASISLTYYYDNNGTATQTTVTAAGTYAALQDYDYSWSATATTGYTLDNSSGSGTVSTTAISVSPTATLNTYTITLANDGNGTWKNASGSAVASIDSVAHGTSITNNGVVDGKGKITLVINNQNVSYYYHPNTGKTVSSVTLSPNQSTVTSNMTVTGNTGTVMHTITWKYRDTYSTWTTVTETYAYNATPSRTLPSAVTSGNERLVATGWDDLSAVTSDRTITANYKTQYNATFTNTYSTANKTNGWYDSGTTVTWTANTNYSFGGSTTGDTSTTTISSGGAQQKNPGYVKCTISGTNCSANKTTGNIYAVGTTITWTATGSSDSYTYGFGTGNTSTLSPTTTQDVALGTTSYSKSASTLYYYITFTNSYCTCNYSSGSYIKNGNTITWTADANHSFGGSSVSDTTTYTVSEAKALGTKVPGYTKCTITTTNCSANKTSGVLLKNGNGNTADVITFTASSGYAYSTTGTTTESKTVTAATTSYSSSAKRYIVVTATNESKAYDGSILSAHNTASITTGSLLSGHTIAYTGSGSTSAANAGSTGTKTVTAVIKNSGGTVITTDYYINYVSGTLSITKATPTVTAPTFVSSTLTYNGAAQVIINAGSSTLSGTFTYSIDGGSYETARSATNAGDHTAAWKFTPADTNNYNIVGPTSLSGSKNIAKATPTFTPTNPTATVAGSAHTVQLSTSVTGNGTITYGTISSITADDGTSIPASLSSITSGGLLSIPAWPAGSYTYVISVTAAESANYNAKTQSLTYVVPLTSAGTASVYRAPVYKTDLEYTGEAQKAYTIGVGLNGQIQYAWGSSLTKGPDSKDDYTPDAKLEVTDAGYYYLWYYVKGNIGYADSAEYCLGELEVKQATPTCTITNGNTTYPTTANGKLEFNVDGTVFYKNSTTTSWPYNPSTKSYSANTPATLVSRTSSDNAGTTTYDFYFMPSDTKNYKWLYSMSAPGQVYAKISKATPTITCTDPADQAFSTIAHTVTLGASAKESAAISFNTSIVVKNSAEVNQTGWSLTAAGVLTIPANAAVDFYYIRATITSAETTNYNAGTVTRDYILRIIKANQGCTVNSVTATYSNSAQTATLVGTATTGNTVTYGTSITVYNVQEQTVTGWSLTAAGKLTIPANAAVGQSPYTVILTVNANGNDNYNPITNETRYVTVYVDKATPTFTKANGTAEYPNTANGTVTASVAGTVYYGTSASSMTSTKAISANTATTIISRTSSSNIGTSTVYAYFVPTDTANYNSVGSASSAAVTVTSTTTVGIVSVPNTTTQSLPYNGDNQSPTYTASKTGMTTSGDTSKKDVGTYTITYTLTSTTNYKWADNTTAAKTKSWSITAIPATLPTTWAGDSVDFHKTATVSASGYVGGTIYYRSSTTSASSGYGSWSTTKPTRTAIGTTWVQCYIKADGNHTDSGISSAVTITVNKVDDAVVKITTTARTYNGEGQVIASLNSGESHGYASYTIGVGTDATNVNNVTWASDNTSVSKTNYGTYYIWRKFTPDGSHSTSGTAAYVGSVTITAAALGSIGKPSNATYTGSAQKPTPAVTATLGDVAVTLVNGTDYTLSYSNNTNAGTATVTATGKGNYTGTKSNTWTITARTVSLNWGKTSWIYDAAKHSTTCVAGNLAGTITARVLSSTCYNGATSQYGYGTTTDIYKTSGTFQGIACEKVYMGTAGKAAYPYVFIDGLTPQAKNDYNTVEFDYYPTSQTSIIFYQSGAAVEFNWTNLVDNTLTSGSSGTVTVTVNKWNHIRVTIKNVDTQTPVRTSGAGFFRIGSSNHTSTTSDYWLIANITTLASPTGAGDSSCYVTLSNNSVGEAVGSATVTATALSNSNYQLPSTKTKSISITPAAYINSGSAWQEVKEMYIWNGSAWVLTHPELY